ncbi:MAG: hypothetical protein BGO06_09120 [Shinella sp. 65-6]|nr:MAG: hypothetical protein BGO06_09120 [Shinella sp. 65-6]
MADIHIVATDAKDLLGLKDSIAANGNGPLSPVLLAVRYALGEGYDTLANAVMGSGVLWMKSLQMLARAEEIISERPIGPKMLTTFAG